MIERVSLKPHKYNQFYCIGPECEDNCCHHWNVAIDKDTYKKYKKVKTIELKQKIKENIIREKDSRTNLDYASIKLDENKNCTFLDDKGLCLIHQQLGEKYLSNTCSTYPRVYNIVDDVLEMSFNMSCPEVVRALLFDKEKMQFDQEISKFNRIMHRSKTINTNKSKISLESYFWNMRMFSIEFLQNREFKLWERLIILGLFLQKVQDHIRNDDLDGILYEIEEYKTITSDKENVKELLSSSIKTNYLIQFRFIEAIYMFRNEVPVEFKAYNDCMNEFKQGLNYSQNIDINDIINIYKKGYKDYFEEYINEKEYVFENYLVHYAFSYLFPIGRSENIFEEYCRMVIHYASVKTYLTGMASYNEKLTDEMVVKLIYSFSRAMNHNEKLLDILYNSFKEKKFFTMEYMLILIKN